MLARKVLVEELDLAHAALREKEMLLDSRAMALEATVRDLAIVREQVRLLEEQYRTVLQENEFLRHRIDQLCRARFGKSSEKVDAAQLALAFAAVAAEDAAAGVAPTDGEPQIQGETPAEAVKASPPRRKGHGRRPLPQDLPRTRVEHHPSEEDRTCGGCLGVMKPIGEETSEQLDYVPASYRVIEHVRVKYACPTCQEGVVIAPPAEKVVEKGLAGPGLIANVIVSKYAVHLPLYRQAEIMGRQGIVFPESTLLDIVHTGAELLEPVARAVGAQILESPVVHADETPVVTKIRPKGTRTGYLFTFTDGQEVYLRFQANRTGKIAIEYFEKYIGDIVMDEFAGYDPIFAAGKARRAGCWAHGRRGFFEALSNDPERAGPILALIAGLYAVETEAKAMKPEERLALRHARSRPLVEQIRALLLRYEEDVLPKSPIGHAVGYVLRAWDHLVRFLADGRIPIDNSAVERAIRPVAVGRKNWLAFGNERGGRCAATLFTLVGSCKQQRINPFEHLRDILTRVSTHPASKIAELTPRGWRAARAPPLSAADTAAAPA